GRLWRNQLDTVHRTYRHAQLATGAERLHDRVHMLGAADDGVDGARLDALRAADAILLHHDLHLRRLVGTASAVEGPRGLPEEARQRTRALVTSRGAPLYPRLSGSHRLGIGPAARVPALAALCLRQEAVE